MTGLTTFIHPYPSVWCVWSNLCGTTGEAVTAVLILAGVAVMVAAGLYRSWLDQK